MADIPLPPSDDIYSYGFDHGLNRAIPDNSTGVVYDSVNDTTNTGNVVGGGNLTLKTLNIGSLTRQVAPGDDIQAAIDAINREGGGTVQLLSGTYLLKNDINLKSNVALVGAGRDITILNFEGRPYGVNIRGQNVPAFGAPGTPAPITIVNVGVANLTIVRGASVYSNNISTYAAGLVADYADFWLAENISVTGGASTGIAIKHSQNFVISNVSASNNGLHGIHFADNGSGGERSTNNFTVLNSMFSLNTGNGFYTNSSGGSGTYNFFTLLNCVASSNTLSGFVFEVHSAYFTVTNCQANSNGVNGFTCTSSSAAYVGNRAKSNTGDGFYITGSNDVYSGNYTELNTGLSFNIQTSVGASVLLVGNKMNLSTSVSPSTQMNFTNVANAVVSRANYGNSIATEKEVFWMKNTSGASLPDIGQVVILKSVSSGEEVTTTNTNGDSKVIGVVSGGTINGTIASNAYGEIQTIGYHTGIYVRNGTSSISIGDWISTSSHAYYGKKAVAGEMSYAIALATPSTGTASIAALLMPPRFFSDATSSPITSGTYTPTLTNVANLDNSSVGDFQFSRVGTVVNVSGGVNVNPTTTATSTQLGISLPVASNFSNGDDCAGVAFSPAIAGQGAAIIADTVNKRAQLQYLCTDVTSQSMYITFQYVIK